MEVNERIFYLLTQQGKKASALAEYLGIKPSSITGWKNEGSYPSSKYIQKISEFLNVSIEYLITGKDNLIPNSLAITSEEQELLDLYSKLNAHEQEVVLSLVKILCSYK